MDPQQDSFRQFRDQQDAWEEAPSPQAWDKLVDRLDAEAPVQATRPWKPLLWGAGIAALLTIGAFLYFSRPNPEPLQEAIAEVVQPAPSTKPDFQRMSDSVPAPVLAEEKTKLEKTVASLGSTRQSEVVLEQSSPDTVPPILNTEQSGMWDSSGTEWWGAYVPDGNYAAFNYDTTELRAGNMIVTNELGNIRDTVEGLPAFQQYRSTYGYNDYLQLNVRRNDISYAPRSGKTYRHDNSDMLTHFNWLLGSWKRNGPGAATLETWQQLDAFTLEGKGLFVVNGDTLLVERMRIEQKGKDIYYIIALDEHSQAIRFRLRSVKPGEAVFRNRKNPFPREITLRRDENGEVTTIYEGNTPKRAVKKLTY